MTPRERALAACYGIKDPQGAIDRWHARQRMGRSFFTPAVAELCRMLQVRIPRQRHRLILDETSKGLTEDQLWGYLGIKGKEPVTYQGHLVMWDVREKYWVTLREPTPSFWKAVKTLTRKRIWRG